jgi:hypothetical protein
MCDIQKSSLRMEHGISYSHTARSVICIVISPLYLSRSASGQGTSFLQGTRKISVQIQSSNLQHNVIFSLDLCYIYLYYEDLQGCCLASKKNIL